jgi:hypothetical protein
MAPVGRLRLPARSWLLLTLAVTGMAAPPWARADTVRRALLLGNKDGGAGLQPLRYTDRDVRKMRDVLTDLGGFPKANIEMGLDEGSTDALKRMRAMQERVKADKAAGHQVILLVYYSGHAKDGALRMGRTRLDMGVLRSQLEDTGADVRLAVLDACGAGEITREKGGVKAPPLVVRVDDGLTAEGQVIIASSSESEASQESDDVEGSFFTHFLVSGLRGDADQNADARVTLDEAYQYAYQRTVAATLNTRGGIQHPTYRYNLRGAGEVVLSALDGGSGSVRFPEESSGRFIVFDLDRKLVVAEVDKKAGKPLRLAVKGGSYAIKKRESDHLLMQRVKVAQKGEVELDTTRMEKVAFERDYAKGPLIEIPGISPPGQGWLGFSMSGGLGVQGFVNVPLTSGTAGVTGMFKRAPVFPATTMITLQGRYHGLFNKHLLLGTDLNFGLRDYDVMVDTGFSRQAYPARFFLGEAGASAMWEQELWMFRMAVGPRVSGIFTWRHFLTDAPSQNQFFLNLTPGVAGYVGLDIFRFLHVELGFRGNAAVFAIDGFQGIGYGSMTLAMHADL